jgi:signal transduction histidine kinase
VTDSAPKAPASAEAPPTELQKLTAIVQHQLNNPLAALLAEAQLLGLEPTLGPEQKAATDRVVELVRRVIGIVRDLDTVVETKLGR